MSKLSLDQSSVFSVLSNKHLVLMVKSNAVADIKVFWTCRIFFDYFGFCQIFCTRLKLDNLENLRYSYLKSEWAKHAKLSEKTFSYPPTGIRTCPYQGIRSVSFFYKSCVRTEWMTSVMECTAICLHVNKSYFLVCHDEI